MTQPPSPWTEELTAHLLAMFETGASSTTISLRFASEHGAHFTRNAIIGKLHRIGQKLADRPEVERPKRSPRVSARNVSAKAPSSPRQPFIPRIVELDALHLTLIDLADGACRYECSKQHDAALFTFCGHPAERGRPYCGHHSAKCFMQVRPRMVAMS